MWLPDHRLTTDKHACQVTGLRNWFDGQSKFVRRKAMAGDGWMQVALPFCILSLSYD
jgi:hypothetical protein